jgi:hypothetical protein
MSIEACLPISLLLQDTLLASTWAWLALGLATIATLIRAFFTRSLRFEPLPPPPPSPPPPPPHPQPDQSTESELENEPLTDRRREAIIKGKANNGKRATAEEGGGGRRRRRRGSISCSCGDFAAESLPFHAGCAQISPWIPPRKQHLHYAIIRDEGEEDCLHFFPSPPPPFLAACAPFEQQFGWDRLLEMKLGMSWACSVDPTFGRMNWTRRRPVMMDGVHAPRSAEETLAAATAADVHESLLLGSVVRLWSASS